MFLVICTQKGGGLSGEDTKAAAGRGETDVCTSVEGSRKALHQLLGDKRQFQPQSFPGETGHQG